jgi:hypothetical protein
MEPWLLDLVQQGFDTLRRQLVKIYRIGMMQEFFYLRGPLITKKNRLVPKMYLYVHK